MIQNSFATKLFKIVDICNKFGTNQRASKITNIYSRS